MIPVTPGVPGRLWTRARRADSGCLEWTGCTNSRGYGCISIDGTIYLAHRVAYELAIGPIPEGLTIDHLCRNKLCLHPAHLEAVTGAENTRRHAEHVKTTPLYPCGHPRSFLNTLTKSRGGRECRACNRERLARSRRSAVAS